MIEEDKRSHRVKSDYGMSDYFKHYSIENKALVDEPTFGKIIREFNTNIRDRLSLKGAEYIFPYRLGKIELRKVKTEVKIDADGNIINNLPVNWKETRRLWKENPGAQDKGIKIRFTNEHTDGHTFRIFYMKSKANYKNKSIYRMQFNRQMKRQLSKSIFAGRIDAFLR
jgi:hypothetical protein